MRYSTGVLLVVLAGALWSLMGLAIRHLDDAGTWAVLFWRSVGMLPVLLIYIARRSGGRVIQPLRRVGTAGLVGGGALVLAFAGAIYAIQATTVANAVFLFSASPFLAAALGALILKEPVRPATWCAIALAGVGMFVMVREGLAAGAVAGNVAALLSAFGFAVFSLSLRWHTATDMLPSVVLGAVFSILVAGVVLAASGAQVWISARDAALCMAMGALILSSGMVLYTLGSRVIPAAELTLLSMIEILLAPVWVWAFLGETATPATFAGGAVVMLAVGLNAMTGLRARNDAAEAAQR